jgi:hypothetical protein
MSSQGTTDALMAVVAKTTTPTAATITIQQNSWMSSSSSSSSSSVHSALHYGAHIWISSTSLVENDAATASALQSDLSDAWMSSYWKEDDTVVRIFDDDSQKRKFLIQLEKNGIVALAGIQAPPPTTEYPTCLSNTPSSKLRQLLPPRSRVQIYKINTSISDKNQPTTTTTKKKNIPTVILQKQSTSSPNDAPENMNHRSVNAQLVQLGYAQVRNTQRNNNNHPDAVLERLVPSLVALQQQAMQQQLGVYQSCSASSSNNNQNAFFVAEFEEYQDPNGDDTTASTPPPNPGDRVGCSDFETYEDSLRYYERYFPYYGDVARLDRDGDGIPCPKLPHTSNREQYRIKKPTRIVPKE